jgi:undecaprenyl-diphosphatase
VRLVDVGEIGPLGSSVGFAVLNRAVHEWTGVNWWLYTLTDWLGLVPISICLAFAILGLIQWIRRRSVLAVDRDLLALGVFYAVVVAVFVLFEMVVINYRPVLIEGILEASYPSSTTLLTMCVIPTAMLQMRRRIKNRALLNSVLTVAALFLAFTVVGRLLSGVHWVTDIIGGAVLSASLVTAYAAVTEN